ncbi:acetyl esterase [Actinokineospora alba]|uniref:Acetyl esterase n=1 Tax=Actinokineospora alba TaxID=504798 RepID=A0A1H0FVK0_9PSEU|nr:alpha/beta hydrolase [Actinokineospora alba]TDP69640.1 acetyl esterase [Actinokineospora alba]SDI12330.1 acetyl esterase [Actinokineospora alba]SDN98697.1 acetyl esterase [Actinokineospora alba]
MPLDRILRNLITWQRADGPPTPLRELSIEDARARYLANAVRPRRGGGPADTVTTADHTIDTADGSSIRARVYRPDTEPTMSITFLHGGGWVVGDLDSHDWAVRALAAALGAVVISADYRRAPEFPYPVPLHDAIAAARWTAREFPGLPHVLAGDSAGAHLSVGVALDARDNGGPRFAAMLLLYPPTDPSLRLAAACEYPEGYLLSVDDMAHHYDLYVPDPARRGDPAVDLLNADLRDLPPAVVATAEFDPLRDEGIAFAERLAAAGVPARQVPGPGLVHGYFLMQDLVPAAAKCANGVLDELAAMLAAPRDAVAAGRVDPVPGH